MSKMGERLIEGLKGFLENLRRNESFIVTKVQKVETPDGSMHVRTKKEIKVKDV